MLWIFPMFGLPIGNLRLGSLIAVGLALRFFLGFSALFGLAVVVMTFLSSGMFPCFLSI